MIQQCCFSQDYARFDIMHQLLNRMYGLIFQKELLSSVNHTYFFLQVALISVLLCYLLEIPCQWPYICVNIKNNNAYNFIITKKPPGKKRKLLREAFGWYARLDSNARPSESETYGGRLKSLYLSGFSWCCTNCITVYGSLQTLLASGFAGCFDVWGK